ncbi:MAG: hypothetical protein MJY49_00785 [Bacteroidales bacterium]|nr:hypothetical protein [Bacteroidales bacterium]
MKVFIAALVLVALCLVGLCFNIIFRKNGHFPDTEIENNEQMKKLGIKCAKAEEMELWGKCRDSKDKPSCKGKDSAGCASCAFYGKH